MLNGKSFRRMLVSQQRCIYLDHHATTPMDERVFLAMEPYFLHEYGNPSSFHSYGWRASAAVDEARYKVAKSINAHPTEIIFTSGATESTNLAIKGVFSSLLCKKFVTSSIEHKATLSTLAALSKKAKVEVVKPASDGVVPIDAVASLVDDQTLVSLFMVHNEVGSINDIESLGAKVKKRGGIFHCDAAQALGRVEIDCQKLGIDMMSLSGHKIYGPKGVGCLYIRRDLLESLDPLIHGGGQEWSKRSGTLNVPGIVGLGEAARIAVLDIEQENKRIGTLRDRLQENLSALDGIFINGSLKSRVSANLNVSFLGVDGEELLLAVSRFVAISTGSACSSNFCGRSHVLKEMGVPLDLCQSALRFGLGRKTTVEEIDFVSKLIVENVKHLRGSQKKLIGIKNDYKDQKKR